MTINTLRMFQLFFIRIGNWNHSWNQRHASFIDHEPCWGASRLRELANRIESRLAQISIENYAHLHPSKRHLSVFNQCRFRSPNSDKRASNIVKYKNAMNIYWYIIYYSCDGFFNSSCSHLQVPPTFSSRLMDLNNKTHRKRVNS